MSGESKPEPKDHQSFNDDASEVRVIPSFDDMPLHQNLLRGIYSYGFEKPSAIQQRAIAPFIRGGDIIAQAQSGTGKTGAFSIGLLQRVDFRHRNLQALVLSPTRELAQQTHSVISQIGEYMSDVEGFAHTFVGGTRVQDDLKKLLLLEREGLKRKTFTKRILGCLHTMERKRILRAKGRAADSARQLYEHVRTKQLYEVTAGELNPEYVLTLQEQLGMLVGGK